MMKKVQRRPRGKTNSPGVVRKAILKFLLLTPEGSASEPDIRDYLKEVQNVSDPKTVRSHLANLGDKNLIEVNRREGVANEWFVTDVLGVPEFVFSEYEEDDLVKIYRAPFFQTHLKDWYVQRMQMESDASYLVEGQETAPVKRHVFTPFAMGAVSPSVADLWVAATEVSPTHFRYVNPTRPHDEAHVVQCLLMVMGRGMRRGEDVFRNVTEAELALIIADLLIDFSSHESLKHDILVFLKTVEFRRLLNKLFPAETIELISDCLWLLSPYDEPMPDEEGRARFDLKIPEPAEIQRP